MRTSGRNDFSQELMVVSGLSIEVMDDSVGLMDLFLRKVGLVGVN